MGRGRSVHDEGVSSKMSPVPPSQWQNRRLASTLTLRGTKTAHQCTAHVLASLNMQMRSIVNCLRCRWSAYNATGTIQISEGTQAPRGAGLPGKTRLLTNGRHLPDTGRSLTNKYQIPGLLTQSEVRPVLDPTFPSLISGELQFNDVSCLRFRSRA